MYYDHFAKHRNTRIGERFVQKLFSRLSQWSLADLPPDARVLEIGIGRGNFAAHLFRTGGHALRYTGIEPNATLCEQARAEGLDARACMVPPFPPDLEKGTFDLVLMSHVLEHFRDHNEALAVLAEIHALLKPGGRFVLFYPDYLDYGSDYFDVDYSHSLILTRSRAENLVTDSGFTILRQAGFRAHLCGSGILGWAFARFIDITAGNLYHLTGKRIFFKAKITFKLNRLMICRR